MSQYRIVFETVAPFGSRLKYYTNKLKPCCHSHEIAEEDWHEVKNDTDDPWTQYNNLKHWEETGEQYIRRVKLYKIDEVLTEVEAADRR